jgi:hypothetical protein
LRRWYSAAGLAPPLAPLPAPLLALPLAPLAPLAPLPLPLLLTPLLAPLPPP